MDFEPDGSPELQQRPLPALQITSFKGQDSETMLRRDAGRLETEPRVSKYWANLILCICANTNKLVIPTNIFVIERFNEIEDSINSIKLISKSGILMFCEKELDYSCQTLTDYRQIMVLPD